MVIKKTKKRSKQKKKRTYKKKGGYNDDIAYDFNKIAHHWVLLLYIETTRESRKHPNNNNDDYVLVKHTLTYQPNTIHIEHILNIKYRIDLSNWKYILNPYKGTITLYENKIKHYHETHDELMKKYKYMVKNTKSTNNHNSKEKLMYETIAKELHEMIMHKAFLQLKRNITNKELVLKKYTRK